MSISFDSFPLSWVMCHARSALSGIAASVVLAPAVAHHSFAMHFVGDKLISVSGTVIQVSIRNPHGVLVLERVGADGTVERWIIETNSQSILKGRGWTNTSIRPGDHVTVEGFPAREGSAATHAYLYRVTLADGRVLTGQEPDTALAGGRE